MSDSTIGIILGIGIGIVLIAIFRSWGKAGNDKDRRRFTTHEKRPVKKENHDSPSFGMPRRHSPKDTYTPRKKITKNYHNPYTYPGYLPPLFDEHALQWCADFLNFPVDELKKILKKTRRQYSQFSIRKRSGGYRTISAPSARLMSIQKTIYYRMLLPATIHPAATGFRKNTSITDNARRHLGNSVVLKTDIRHFFSSIKYPKVVCAFQEIGYPKDISKVMASLCCLRQRLPQGAPTSPALSNIISYGMDEKLTALAGEHRLTYTRYADDLTFSGDRIDIPEVLGSVGSIAGRNGFELKGTKTRYMGPEKRKIVTGISISSGEKMTIPRAKKREMRKNIHFILTKGLAGHQSWIRSKDPAYLKRILGYLHFWLSVEPDNQYVIKSIQALKRLQR